MNSSSFLKTVFLETDTEYWHIQTLLKKDHSSKIITHINYNIFFPSPLACYGVLTELWESEVIFNSGLQTINTAADSFPVADAFWLMKLESEETQFGFDVSNALWVWLPGRGNKITFYLYFWQINFWNGWKADNEPCTIMLAELLLRLKLNIKTSWMRAWSAPRGIIVQ